MSLERKIEQESVVGRIASPLVRFGRGCFCLWCVLLFSSSSSFAGEPEVLATWPLVRAKDKMVSQNLLKLVHTREVQKELGLVKESVGELEAALERLDATWWKTRNIDKEEKRREAIEELEAELLPIIESVAGRDALIRLRQIELQSQGVRACARPDVQKFLSLTSKQIESVLSLFQASYAIESKAKPGTPLTADLEKKLRVSKAKEVTEVARILTEAQKRDWNKLVGSSFETSELKRIYPLAPELVSPTNWVTGSPTSLKSLRGQVVLLHFYAFECHNCHANFKHYLRWHKTLEDQGVVVLGIQTPETKRESDFSQVRQAALSQGFEFPVLFDEKGQNWDAWSNSMWPTVYVIDKQGYIRFWWQGELNWNGATGDQKIEKLVRELLAEEDA